MDQDAAQPTLDEMFGEGVCRFNARRFWDAHESWEHIWLASTGPERQFIQGLIQLAAAFFHMERGNARGAIRLFTSALQRLEPFPEGHRGLMRGATTAHANWLLENLLLDAASVMLAERNVPALEREIQSSCDVSGSRSPG